MDALDTPSPGGHHHKHSTKRCIDRLRPQVFNTVRRNEAIIQCDSCQRILYFIPVPVPAPSASQPT